MSPPASQLKELVVVKGKTTPKGKSYVKGQTMRQVKGITMQSKVKVHVSLSNTGVPTPLPVQLVVVSPPAGTSMTTRPVASSLSQSAESVSPNSLAAVVRRMKEATLTDGTNEPILEETEVEHRCVLVQRCAAGMQFPPLTMVVTSLSIIHTMSMSGLTQQTKVDNYQSAGVTSVVASHLSSLSSTGSVAHEGCSKGVLG